MNRFLLSACVAGGIVFGSLGGASPGWISAAERAADQQDQDESDLKGEVRTVDFDSKHLGESRQVKIYLPPGHTRKKSYPVIYCGDAFDCVKCENIEPLITSGKVPPFIVIGTDNGPGEMRQKEYCPGWPDGEEAFTAHEKFFIEEVLPWAEKEFGASKERKDRVIYGSSNGGPFALTMANRHPDLFGHVFAFMVYGMEFDIFERELKGQKKNPTRYILVAGSEDAHGIEENERVEELLREKKFPVSSAVIEGFGHQSELEYQELNGCIEATFGNKKYQPVGQTVERSADQSAEVQLSEAETAAVKSVMKAGGQVHIQSSSVIGVDFSQRAVTDAKLKELLKDLKQLKKLQTLSFKDSTRLTDTGLKDLTQELKGWERLRLLYLGHTAITDAGLKELAEWKGLQELGLGNTKVTDAGLKELKQCEKLQTVYLTNTRVTDAGLRELKEVKGLRKLILLNCDNVTNTGVDDLKKALPKLKVIANPELQLPAVEAAAFKAVKKAGGQMEIEGKSVTTVDFSQRKVADTKLKELLKDLKELKKLRALSFEGSTHLTDDGLMELAKELQGLKKLQFLDLGRTGITDTGLKRLTELKGLQELGLARTKMTDAGLKDVKHFERLRALDLGYTRISSTGLQELQGSQNLQQLDLTGCATDTSLKELQHLGNLKVLALAKSQVTDAGLLELNELKELRKLDLTDCVKVTRTGITDLKKAMPKLQITTSPDLQLSEDEAAAYKAVKNSGGQVRIQGKSITAVVFSQRAVTDEKMKGLLKDFKELKKLQTLSFVGSEKLTDEGLTELVQELKDLELLRLLYLGHTGITDAGLKRLAELRGLQELGLGQTQITDVGMRELRHFEKLKTLFLANTQVTDDGLKELQALKELRKLDLTGCAKVTKAGVDDLKKALPKLQITR